MAGSGKLKLTAPSDREIRMTRVFNAPRRLIFDVWARSELLVRWLGPRTWPLVLCEVDLRVGGAYRFVSRGPDGSEMGSGGVYREIEPPGRIVQTEVFDQPWYPGEAQVTGVLTEENGRTTMTITILYQSREARDMVLRSPMKSGIAESYDRLEELLASTPAQEGAGDRGRG